MGGLSEARRHADDFLSIATVRGPAAGRTFCKGGYGGGQPRVYAQGASEDVISSSENRQEIDLRQDKPGEGGWMM